MRKFIEGFAKDYNVDLTDAFAVNEIEEKDVIEYYIKNQVNTSDATSYLIENIGTSNEVEFDNFKQALDYFIDTVTDDFKKGDDLLLSADDEELVAYNDDSHKYIKNVMKFLYKLYDQLEDEEFQEEYKKLTPFAKILSDNQTSAYRVFQITGISQATLSDWSSGSVDFLQTKTVNIYKISKYFGITVEEFLEKMGVI